MLYDFFFNLSANSLSTWVGKIIGFPLITFMVVFLLHGVIVRIRTGNLSDPFPIRSNLMLMYSIIAGSLLVNVGWFSVLLLNNSHTFTWSSFPFNSSNVYYALSPLILTQVCLAVFFMKIQSNTLKQY